MNKRITFVTGLWDINRGSLGEGFNRPFEHYLETFSKLLKLDINLLIYAPSGLNDFIMRYRKSYNTKIINKELKDLDNFPFNTQVQNIRTSERWLKQSEWLKESPQAKLRYYNLITLNKHFLLNDATLFNPFNTDLFCWIDAGLANTVNLDAYLSKKVYDSFERKLVKHLRRMLYLCFPYDGKVEVHGFSKAGMNRYAGQDTEYVARGGFFGGNKHTINKINEIYYDLLNRSLNEGEMGTEESIFTIITYQHPELCEKHMIESNGLVYKFFEDVINEKEIEPEHPLAFYSLTYNTPKQFKMWIESFIKAYPDEFFKTKKYVIDNSTDEDARIEYKKMFDQYEFEVVHEGKNLGIQDGRQLCATHFDQSDHKYYVFFEEDFLLVDRSDPVQIKDGFIRYIPNVFKKSIDILEHENLDFLRLTVIEFFGNNIYDWSFKNLPQSKKDEYFPKREDGNEDLRWKSKVDYLGIRDNVAYAVGHFHYSNWPILFNKRGNRQVFLDIVYEHLYEQTVMSQAKMFMMDGKLKVGTLLAAPINHNRVHHYDGKTRRENRHYKN